MSTLVPPLFDARRSDTGAQLGRLAEAFGGVDLEAKAAPHVALYATGSLGRGEVGPGSDLDVFLVDTAAADEGRLTNLRSIVLRAALIEAAERARFGSFSRDGEYLVVHHLDDLLGFLGTREDDTHNLFTARMLLLLESEPLAGTDAYERAVGATIAVYARDARERPRFVPTFFVNDVVRYWKTLCLNYEAKRHAYYEARHAAEAEADRPGREAREARVETLRLEHRLDLLKLRFNRLWTSFNGLAFVLAGAEDGKVAKDHMRRMVELKPVDRALEIAERLPETREPLARALDAYAQFLAATEGDKETVLATFAQEDPYRTMRRLGGSFGDELAAVVGLAAQRAGLERYLLI